MKHLLLSLFAIIFIGTASQAQTNGSGTKKESASVKIKKGSEVANYKFNTVEDLRNNTDKLFDDAAARPVGSTDECTVTVEISITVSIGLVSTTVTGSVTAPCSQISGAAKKLRAQLIDIATGG
ncbi:hypothetical protein [Flavobacterium sp. 3HN19-14]|uniref:hypothetical protein n=1 Tax=Flavobacterium sp. 3HN19-14 TaxID=3448133 RepID=UPI003EE3D7FB